MDDYTFIPNDNRYKYGDIRDDRLEISVRLKWNESFKQEVLELEKKLRKIGKGYYDFLNKTFEAWKSGRTSSVFKNGFNVVLFDGQVKIGINVNKRTVHNTALCFHLESGCLLQNDGCDIVRNAVDYLVNKGICLRPLETDFLMTRAEICRDLLVPMGYYGRKYTDEQYVTRLRAYPNRRMINSRRIQ